MGLIDDAVAVCDVDFAEVLFDFNFYLGVTDRACKLVEIDIDLHFGVFVGPGKLLDFFLLNFVLLSLSLSLHFLLRARLYQNRIAPVNFSVSFEVFCAFLSKVFWRMRIVVRLGTFSLDTVEESIIRFSTVEHTSAFIYKFLTFRLIKNFFSQSGFCLFDH